METIPVKNRDIVWRELEGEAVLLNPHSGKYFGLNSTGCSFWEKIDGIRSLEEITGLMMKEYKVNREILEKDIRELAAELRKHDIVHFKD